MSFSLLSAAPTALSPQEQRPRLLVVDDLPLNVQILSQLFRHEYEVSMATNGSEALEFCDRRPLPDLILLDVMMPGMDGLEVCRRLQRNPITADIPVIFVTAQSSAAQETAALEAGGVDFISKPFVPAVVRARVRSAAVGRPRTRCSAASAPAAAHTRCCNWSRSSNPQSPARVRCCSTTVTAPMRWDCVSVARPRRA